MAVIAKRAMHAGKTPRIATAISSSQIRNNVPLLPTIKFFDTPKDSSTGTSRSRTRKGAWPKNSQIMTRE